MLDGIVDLVKKEALGVISNNTDVPDDKKEVAVETTTSALVDGFKEHFTLDNLSSITSLFNGGSDTNGLENSLQSSVISALTDKVGLNKDVATSISSAVIPALFGLLSKKSNDENDSFSIESLVNSLTGGKSSGGILGALKGLFGGK
ncbi:MAG: DUF937 domain-containing protein [Dysgonomonas sp.]